MACCEYHCPVHGCTRFFNDNESKHWCPVHGVPMIRTFDEQEGEEEEEDGDR